MEIREIEMISTRYQPIWLTSSLSLSPRSTPLLDLAYWFQTMVNCIDKPPTPSSLLVTEVLIHYWVVGVAAMMKPTLSPPPPYSMKALTVGRKPRFPTMFLYLKSFDSLKQYPPTTINLLAKTSLMKPSPNEPRKPLMTLISCPITLNLNLYLPNLQRITLEVNALVTISIWERPRTRLTLEEP